MDENLQRYLTELYDMISDLRDHAIFDRAKKCINPLNHAGAKTFSQTDEDGITLEILNRLSLENGTYCEFGIGNGLENNTLILAALGWSGFWVDESKSLKVNNNSKFNFIERRIDLNNIIDTYKYGLAALGKTEADLISMDFESNDYYFVEKLLENKIYPKVFIVEYNAKFIPPIKFVVKYEENNSWQGDDYFGASLMSYVKLFDKHEYMLVCCNAFTGANAFFVPRKYGYEFDDVPKNIKDIWVSPNYYMPRKYGHILKSQRVVELILNRTVDNR